MTLPDDVQRVLDRTLGVLRSGGATEGQLDVVATTVYLAYSAGAADELQRVFQDAKRDLAPEAFARGNGASGRADSPAEGSPISPSAGGSVVTR